MDRSKYIVIEISFVETPIVFPVWLNHADMALAFTRGAAGDRGVNIVSAGFVSVTPRPDGGIHVDCFGRSESLKCDAREGDGALLASALKIG